LRLSTSESNIEEYQRLASKRPLTGFLAPRYWSAWLFVAWLRFAASLPWNASIRLHEAIGRFFRLLMPRHRRVVERNLRLCFAGSTDSEIRRLVRLHFESLGTCLAETAFAWFGKVNKSLAPFHIEGEEHVRSALAKGCGVILYTGHFTPIEICGPILGECLPQFGFMFHQRRNALLDEIQRRGRLCYGHLAFSSGNVRAMLRALKRNAVVWYAADQHFASRNATVLPFFGEPVELSTAGCRLARASGAAIVPFSYRRLPNGQGYSLCFEPALDDLDCDDAIAGTRRLVGVLERFIRRCPEQYCWSRHLLKSRVVEPQASGDVASVATSK
jgi:KDO2-lipid IV(A) lauroyltransferase